MSDDPNNQRWQHLYHQWNKEKDSLYDERRQREHDWQQLREEYAILKSQYDLAIQQLVDKQDHIQELQRLHQQTQQNHDHFCQTILEQRQMEQSQFSEQKSLLQAEIKTLNKRLIALTCEKDELQKNCQQLERQYASVSNAKSIIESALLARNTEFEHCEKDKHEYSQSSRHWELKYNKIQQDFAEHALRHQSEIQLLSQQLVSAQQLLQTTESKNVQLQQENIALIQASSILEGRIKQWELSENFISAS